MKIFILVAVYEGITTSFNYKEKVAVNYWLFSQEIMNCC